MKESRAFTAKIPKKIKVSQAEFLEELLVEST